MLEHVAAEHEIEALLCLGERGELLRRVSHQHAIEVMTGNRSALGIDLDAGDLHARMALHQGARGGSR